jgi:hypothetical protein
MKLITLTPLSYKLNSLQFTESLRYKKNIKFSPKILTLNLKKHLKIKKTKL